MSDKQEYDGEALILPKRLSDVEREQQEARQRDENYKNEQLRLNRQQVNLNGRMARFTLALVLCSVLSGGVAIWQSLIAKRSADAANVAAGISRDTFDLTYRPRLKLLGISPQVQFFEPVKKKNYLKLDNGRLVVQIDVPNAGPFAARNVRFFRYSYIAPRTQLVKHKYEELFGEPKLIPPKADGNWTSAMLITGEGVVTQEEIEGLEKGTFWAVFSILISYDDDLARKTHHTEYCDLFTLQPYNDICPWPVQND